MKLTKKNLRRFNFSNWCSWVFVGNFLICLKIYIFIRLRINYIKNKVENNLAKVWDRIAGVSVVNQNFKSNAYALYVFIPMNILIYWKSNIRVSSCSIVLTFIPSPRILQDNRIFIVQMNEFIRAVFETFSYSDS